MHLVVVLIVLEFHDCLLPVGSEDVAVVVAESLHDLRRYKLR